MKQGVSPAVAAIVIVVVVLIIGAVGYLTVYRGTGDETPIEMGADPVDAGDAAPMGSQDSAATANTEP